MHLFKNHEMIGLKWKKKKKTIKYNCVARTTVTFTWYIHESFCVLQCSSKKRYVTLKVTYKSTTYMKQK